MKLNKYKNGIDFTFATFALRLPWMRDYTRFLVDSIHKHTKDIPYKIYIVYNYVTDEFQEKHRGLKYFNDGKNELEVLKEMFGNDEHVILVEGVDQSATTRLSDRGEWFQDSGTFPGSIDKCPVRAPSKYHSEGLTIGAKEGKQKYICYLDPDCVFVNDWTEELLPLLEKYFYISNRWDPGTMFFDCEKPQPRSDRVKAFKEQPLTESELGRGCPQFMIMKRESCENNKLWPGISYRDVGSNITWFAQTKDLPFMCLKNSYWWSHWRGHKGVSWDDVKDHTVNPENNILKMTRAKEGYIHEEAFLPTDGNSIGKSFWVHQVKHGVRPRNQNDYWIKAISKILYGTVRVNGESMTKEQFEKHLQKLTDEITNEAKLLVNDYNDNPSKESGSVVQIHEKSPYIASREERLIINSDVKLKRD